MKSLEKPVGALELAFFVLAFLALAVGVAGSPGWGLLLLLLAGAAFAARAGLEDAGWVKADDHSRALPIVRQGAGAARRGAGAAWHGAVLAQGSASAAWTRARAARAQARRS